MCGIAGIYMGDQATGGRDRERQLVERMTSVLAHRGPDADGLWQDDAGRCSLGHRRLSIIDLSSAGAQPMAGAGTPWVISFNGEIYNFRQLRAELEREGARFLGRSDTEVLLHAVSRWGPDCLARIDGMFAFGAFNTETGELLLARDPFGEKPLYYTDARPGGIAFASELHALALLPWLTRAVSHERLAELLMFQYIGAPRTIYEGVSKLPPGHFLHVAPGREARVEPYFRFEPADTDSQERPLWQAADELEDLLATSLERRLMSDVPLGALLSGGVDSSLACALVRRKLGYDLKTFSFGFADVPDSETHVASRFASEIESDHRELIVDAPALDFLRQVGTHLDEPNGDVSCFPTYMLSKLVREHVTVAISGDGGDEMFGGYGRYLATVEDAETHPLMPLGAEYYSGAPKARILTMGELEIRGLFGDVPPALRAHLQSLRADLDVHRGRPLAAMRQSDAVNYLPGAVLPKVDRMSMRHSLEVRTPYLSPDVAAFAAQLPQNMLVGRDRGKLVLREVAYRFLPRDLVDMPKRGFGLPTQLWGGGAVTGIAQEMLGSDESRLRAALGASRVDHYLHRPYRLESLWAIVALESWLRAHDPDVERAGSARAADRASSCAPPPPKARRARWLTDRTLLLADADLCDPTSSPEVDGRTSVGQGVMRRTDGVLRALRPLIAEERDVSHSRWMDLEAHADPGAALRGAGFDVTDARVVWLRTDALVEHGRPRAALSRGRRDVSVSIGMERWRAGARGMKSEASLTGSESLLVANPLDDSTELPIVAHHRRLSRARMKRLIERRRGMLIEARVPSDDEAERIAHDIASAPPAKPRATDLGRVTLVTHALPPGGAERQWCLLAQGLEQDGLEVRFVTTHPLGGVDSHYTSMLSGPKLELNQLPDMDAGTLLEGVAGVDIQSDVHSQATEFSGVALRLTALLRNSRPDAVIAQLDQTNIVAGFASVRAGVPSVVLSFRNYNPDNFSYLRTGWYRSSYRALARRQEVVLSGNSAAGNEDYANWIGVRPREVHIVPNAVSVSAISVAQSTGDQEGVRRELGIGSEDPVVLGVFRLSEEKRPELFVEACARAAERVPRMRALIAGIGPLEQQVADLAELYGIADVVTLLGARRDMTELFAIADVLLVTSRFEGMPNVVLEALVSGLPVVAPRVGAVPDLVESGVSGIVTESDSPEALASATVDVLADSAAWEARSAERGTELASQFSVGRMSAGYRDIALNGARGAGVGAIEP